MLRVISPLLAACNLLLAAILLALPAVMGGSHGAILALSIVLVSVQAGQSAAVQTNQDGRVAGSIINPIAVLLFGISLLVQIMVGYSWPTLVVLSAAGLLAGVVIGAKANELLRGDKGVRGYQYFLVRRSLIWLTLVAVSTALLREGPFIGSLIAWAAILVYTYSRSEKRPTGFVAIGPVTAVGALAALAYRNDVNIVRASAARADVFETWHLILVIYALIQAVTGFVALQLIFARSEAVLTLVSRVPRPVRLVPGLVAAATAAVVLLIGAQVSVAALVALLVVASVAVGCQSSLAHISGHSAYVYVAGGLGFAGCFLVAFGAAMPSAALAVELLVIGVGVAPALLIKRRVRLEPGSSVLVKETV